MLDAALRVWSDVGAGGVTMAAIAEAAAVSKPVLYECFANKDAVLLALLEREERRLLSTALASLPTSIDVDDPHADTVAAYRSFFEAVITHPLSWRVVFDAQRPFSGAVPAVVARRYAEGRGEVVRQVSTLLAVTSLAPAFRGEAELVILAEHAVSLAETNGWLLLQPGTSWRADTLAEVVARLLLGGLRGA